jgi:hypothetical protein
MQRSDDGFVLVRVEELARIFELSIRRVQQLIPHGPMRPYHGMYVLGPCMLWFIRHQSQRLYEIENGYLARMRYERTRRLRAVTELKLMRLEERKRQLIPFVEVERAFAELVSRTQAAATLAAKNIAAELLVTSPCGTMEETIRKHLVHMLRMLAEGSC